MYSEKSSCIRAKVVVFGQSCCIQAKVVVFEEKLLYSGKGCFIRALNWLYPGKVVVFGKSGCVRTKWLYLSKSGCIWAKVGLLGQMVAFK